MKDKALETKWELELAQYTLKDKEVWINVKEFNVQICATVDGVTIDVWSEGWNDPVGSLTVLDQDGDKDPEEDCNGTGS